MAKASKKGVMRKVFAEQCKVNYNTLTMDIRRGKCVLLEDGTIDPSNPLNKKYRDDRLAYHSNKVAQTKINFDEEKKQLEKERLQEQVLEARIKRQKMEGQLIPTDMAQGIIRTHLKNMQRSFYHASEQIVSDAAKIYGVKAKDLGKMKEALVMAINVAHDDARDATRNDIKVLIEEYTGK